MIQWFFHSVKETGQKAIYAHGIVVRQTQSDNLDHIYERRRNPNNSQKRGERHEDILFCVDLNSKLISLATNELNSSENLPSFSYSEARNALDVSLHPQTFFS